MSDSLLTPDLGIRFQRVRHGQLAESSRERSREHPLDIAVDDARERDVAALDDDVDRRVGHGGGIPERRIAVDGARHAVAELVVVLRHREHADVAAYGSYAVDLRDPLLEIVF